MEEDRCEQEGRRLATQLLTEMSLVEAMRVAEIAAMEIRGKVREERDRLDGVLGEPLKAPRRERPPTPQEAPVSDEDAEARIRIALANSRDFLSARTLAMRTKVKMAQVKAILSRLPATQHWLKFKLKAAP